jgi:hypothetical protein
MLMMRSGCFRPSRTLTMRVYDKSYSLESVDLIRQGREFEIGRFRIMGEPQSDRDSQCGDEPQCNMAALPAVAIG